MKNFKIKELSEMLNSSSDVLWFLVIIVVILLILMIWAFYSKNSGLLRATNVILGILLIIYGIYIIWDTQNNDKWNSIFSKTQ